MNPTSSNSPTSRLPAIRLKIGQHVVDSFLDPIKLKNEIIWNKQVDIKNIKLAKLIQGTNVILIATDDQGTYDILNTNWSNDAFIAGVTLLSKAPSTSIPYSLTVSGIHKTVDLESEEVKKELSKIL